MQKKTAKKLHEKVPPDWYFESIKINLGQRYWHNKRFNEVKKVIEPVRGKVLDIGSADGVFSKVILDKTGATELIGIDVLPKSVSWANKHWKGKKMKFKIGDAERLEFPDDTFEAVFALEVLEHVFEPEKVLKEVRRVLKKGGYAVFLVPADTRLFRSIWFFWTKFLRGKIWDETHIQSFRKGSLAEIAKKVGLKVEVDKKFNLGMLHLIKARLPARQARK